MAGLSPTQRTLRLLRQQGRIAAVVEKYVQIPPSKKHPKGFGFRKDLFGFIDVISLDPEYGVIAIQSCGQSFKQHIDKIMDSECTENAIEWLKDGKCECGNQLTHIEVYGWRKLKLKRGGKAMKWQPRIQKITLEDLG